MAAEEKRSITIKVNGQDVAASVKLVEKELAKARLELKRSEIGSADYNKAMARIRELSPILNKHNADLRNVGKTTEEVGNKAKGLSGIFQQAFSKLGGGGVGGNLLGSLAGAVGPIALLTGGVSSLGGILSSGVTKAREFETAVANLKVRTGITAEGVNELKNASIELGKAYGTVPQEIIKAFGEAASARPELVANTEALKQFTEQGLLLSKITGDDINTSISNLASIMNTNGIATSDTADAVNILVGASQRGAKEIPFLAQAMEKVGGTAANANVGLAEQAAVIEVLGEKYTSSAETAGTNLRNILIILQQEWQKSNEGPFNLQEALNQLAPDIKNITSLTNLFGKENVVAATTLIENRDRVRELTGEISQFSGASTLAEESQRTLDGQLSKLSARFDGYWASLSNGNGFLTSLAGGFDMLLEKIEIWANAAITAFRAVFDAEDLAAERQAARDKKLSDMKKNAATDLVETKGLDEAKRKLDAINQAMSQLNSESERYKQLQRDAEVIKTAITQKESDLAEAEKKRLASLAAEEKAADDNRRAAAAEREKEARKREEENARQIAQQREMIRLENEKIQKIGSKGFERGPDFKGTPGQGDLLVDPLQSTIDLEAQKQALFEQSLQKQRELQAQHEVEMASLQEQADRERANKRLQTSIDIYQGLEASAFQIISVGAAKRTKRELQALENQKKQGLITEKEYDAKRQQIEREGFERNKRLQIAQTLINTAAAVMKTFAELGWPAGVVPAALLGAKGLAEIVTIKAQEYGEGGMVEGKSHANGGVPAVMEGGEYVVRKRNVNPATLPVLEAINEGRMPRINYQERGRTLMFERGGLVPGASVEPAADAASMMVVRELQSMRMELAAYEREKRVIMTKEDRDEFDGRVSKVELVARA